MYDQASAVNDQYLSETRAWAAAQNRASAAARSRRRFARRLARSAKRPAPQGGRPAVPDRQ